MLHLSGWLCAHRLNDFALNVENLERLLEILQHGPRLSVLEYDPHTEHTHKPHIPVYCTYIPLLTDTLLVLMLSHLFFWPQLIKQPTERWRSEAFRGFCTCASNHQLHQVRYMFLKTDVNIFSSVFNCSSCSEQCKRWRKLFLNKQFVSSRHEGTFSWSN